MKRKIIIFLPVLLLALLLYGYISTFKDKDKRCDCQPVDHPYRTLAKHDIVLSGLPERKSFITVETIRNWEDEYPIDLVVEKNASGRIKNTPEDTIYNLEGWLYEIKTDKPDCDLHLQVGTQNPKAPRVVIEIPLEECVLQDSVIKKFLRKGFVLDAQNFKGAYFEAKGPAFFDGNNRGRKGKKHTAGCTWEIHPVKSIVFK